MYNWYIQEKNIKNTIKFPELIINQLDIEVGNDTHVLGTGRW